MTTQQTENQKMGTYGSHTTEACPLNSEENRKLLLEIASTFEKDTNSKGIKVLSMYHSGLEHTFEWIVESTGAHAVWDLMVETKVAKFNEIKNCSIMDNCKSSEVPQKY